MNVPIAWIVCLLCLFMQTGQPAQAQVLHDYVPPSPRNARTPSRSTASTRAPRQTTLRPDRNTDRYAVPGYRPVFDPTVMPFKRSRVYDAVAPDGRLLVRDDKVRIVPLVSAPQGPGWTKFEAEIPLGPQTGRNLIPIPSVAPQMLISRVRTNPPLGPVRILKDGADNFFLQAQRRSFPAVTLHMVCWAPNQYFGGPLPDRLPRTAPSSLTLPPSIATKAARVVSALGLPPGADQLQSLEQLVGYFRSFILGRLTVTTGDTYLDIALSRRGLCRHRAYAFVITAIAMGIQARMVTNEVHAFAEVNLGTQGWRRIDLGGATPNPSGSLVPRRRHRPAPDPFPWPGDSRSSSPHAVASRSAMPRIPGHRGAFRRKDATSGTAPGNTGSNVVVLDMSAQSAGVRVGQVDVHTTGMRGSPLRVAGRITGLGGSPPGRKKIQVILAPPGSSKGYLLGWTRTDAQGRFLISKPIPKTLPVGTYQILIGE